MIRIAAYMVLAAAALVLQATWFGDLHPGGAVPDPILVLAVTAGLLRGSEEGAVVGAGAGLLQDVMTGVPLGLGMLANLCAGFCAGLGEGSVYVENVWLPVLAAVSLTAVRAAVWLGAAHLVGLLAVPLGDAARITLLAACYNGCIAIPIFHGLRRLDETLARLSERPS